MRIAIEQQRILSTRHELSRERHEELFCNSSKERDVIADQVDWKLVKFSEVAPDSSLEVTIDHLNRLSRIDNLEPVFIDHRVKH